MANEQVPAEIALNLLEERGWTKGVCNPDTGPLCLIMAVWTALGCPQTGEGRWEEYFDIAVALGEQVGIHPAFYWNDATGTTYEDVVLALKHEIEREHNLG